MDKKGTQNVKILTKNKTNAHFSNTKMRVLEKDIIFLNLLVDPTKGGKRDYKPTTLAQLFRNAYLCPQKLSTSVNSFKAKPNQLVRMDKRVKQSTQIKKTR